MTAIAQCPWCDPNKINAAILNMDAGFIYVACEHCNARGPGFVAAPDNQDKAVHAWNNVVNQAASTKDMLPQMLEMQETIEILRNEVKFLRNWRERQDQFTYQRACAIEPWLDIAHPGNPPLLLDGCLAAFKDAIKYQTILKKYGKTFKSLFDEVENDN